MPLPAISTNFVTQLFPAAPAVTTQDLQAAADWAEEQVELAGAATPVADTRQWRELRRAVAAYALYLATGGRAASSRLSVTAGSGAVKSVQLGTLKLERAAVNTEALAQGMATSAEEWLAIAGRHLAGAGIIVGYAFPGAAR